MLRVEPIEKMASWSSPVLRAAITEVMEELQRAWRMSVPTHRQRLRMARLGASPTSFLTPITLTKVTVGSLALLILLAHLQTVLLVLITLALSYVFLRQLKRGASLQHGTLLSIFAPVLMSLGALLGSANLGTAAPWLLVILLAQVLLLVMRSNRKLSPEPTWPELLQTLTQAQPLTQLVALETLRQQARQGQLDATQRQVLRQVLQLLLEQEIAPEVRQAILTALPHLSPRRSCPRLAPPKPPLYLHPSLQLSTVAPEALEQKSSH